MEKTLNAKLCAIQSELKAPKGQMNNFGKYRYRSCEDILEALKPLLAKQECTLIISDTIEMIGDRFYVVATARLSDGKEVIESTAYAREAEDKKGMDASQITGASSSYARKCALNGMFVIDDTKDADTQDNTKESDLTDAMKAKIDAINTLEDLKTFYEANKGKGKDFNAYVVKRKGELTKVESK